MQAKASVASSSSAEHSGMRFPTSGVISKMPAQNTLAQSSRSSGVKLNLVADAEQQPGLPDDVPMQMFPILLRSQ
ncbi:uncharacterized protein F5891DRAFT_1183657 [Suillus fuscotomentosus]|uniref:Uncharacterized protein n=1 Tax=Suillus fuscotomentosus TaxID=1912939 RepID=A0AAD4EHD0_9AGAM|nr:uncharacterized protein F5891DRAFT_1183657 [Suillus fuscotomentosus]KAG1904998.1 hypothetical protein F5891DRAFT_1183657 [Suillus fuscotomentosus]